MSEIEKLDSALKWFYNEYKDQNWHRPFGIIVAKWGMPLKLKTLEIILICNKLHRDGYLDVLDEKNIFNFDEDKSQFALNYNGAMFHLAGGYTQQLKDTKQQRFRTFLHNLIVGVGAGLAGVYVLWKILKGIYTYLFPCVASFLQ